MSLNKKFRVIVAFVTAMCFSFNVYAQSNAVVYSLYNYAHSKNVTKMRYMLNNLGYDVDTEDDDGNTAYCIAKERKDTCAMSLLEQFGADSEQKCGSSWGLIAGVVGVAAAGGAIAALAGGGGGGGDKCHGFKGDDGICYDKIDCLHGGKQYRDTCDCTTSKPFDGAKEYEGAFCEICNGVEKDGVCYPILDCNSPHGSQDGGVCVCDTANGYTGAGCTDCISPEYGHYGSPTECYKTLACEHGTQEGATCKCETGWAGELCNVCDTANGWIDQGGTCYKQLDCKAPGSDGTQTGNSCNCNTGYKGTLCDSCDTGYGHHGNSPYCYANIDCGDHGTQYKDGCNCSDGYSGTYCDVCNGSVGADGICYPPLDCGDHGQQQGNTCVCDAGYGRDGTGKCVVKGSAETILGDNSNSMLATREVGDMFNYGDLYGKTYDADPVNPSDNIVGLPEELYLNMLQNIDHGITAKDSLKNLGLNQYSDGDVYGVTSVNADNIYMTYLWLTENVGSGEQTTSLTIQNGNVMIDPNTFEKSEEGYVTGGNGNAYGVYATGNGYSGAPINVYNMAKNISGNGNANNITMSSTIEVTTIGSGDSYGMYSGSGNVNNGLYDVNTGTNSNTDKAVVNVTAEGTGDAYGLYAGGSGSIVNSGKITVESNSGNAVGIYGNGGSITNTNKINVSTETGIAVGIYANGGSVTNSGTITVSKNSGDAYGIYATNGATVSNTGTIKVNGVSHTGSNAYGKHIVLDGGALLTNFGLMSYEGTLDFDSYNGAMELGKNGVYSAESIKGTLNVDSSVVEKGFADKYVEASSLKSSDIEVNAVSKSVMFEASVEKDAGKESSSVVLNRKTFEELLGTSSVSKYLEANYKAGNDEALYSNLKQQTSLKTFANTVAEELGYGLLPNFAQENMRVFRSLTNTLNEELFETSGEERSMVGYDYLYQERETKGVLTGYENHSNTMYFMYDRELDSLFRSGFGMSITQFSSDYEDDSSRDELMVQGIIPISYIQEKGINYASTIRVGYGDGEYERRLSDDKYESDLTSWLYGISNAVRYKLDLGFVELEPTVELNVMGYYQDKIEETEGKRGSISTDAENNLSVEAGVGLNVKKAIKFGPKSNIKLKAGAMYYHEYANPYHSLEARRVGMSDSYLIRDEESIYEKDRGVISAGIDYEYKPFTIYGNYRHFIEEENPFEVNAGIKFNF